MLNFLKALWILIGLFHSLNAQAFSDFFEDGKLRLGTGYLAYNTFKNTTKEDASNSTFGTNYIFPLQVQYRIELFNQIFSPRFLYTAFSEEAVDKSSKSYIQLISLPWVYPFSERFEIQAGIGYMIRTIDGDGGTVDLGNGTSTATFAFPGRTTSSKNFTAEIGVDWNLSDFIVSLNSIFTSVVSEKRSVSFLLTLNYKI